MRQRLTTLATKVARPRPSIAISRCIRSHTRAGDDLRSYERPGTTPSRAFHVAPPLLKQKGGKQESKRTADKDDASRADNNPYEMGVLDDDLKAALVRLKEELAKLRAGGRFNHELLEGLRVTLAKAPATDSHHQPPSAASTNATTTIRLGDLAQVIPKGGRTMLVLVNDAAHIKAITSAIMASSYSLNPVPSPHNPLELGVPIPPPTAESRQQVLKDADRCCELTLQRIRQSRGQQQKKLRTITLTRAARPDDVKKAGDQMEKMVERAHDEVRTLVKAAKKALEG